MASGEEPTSNSFFSRIGSKSREFLELVNCLREGLASLRVLSWLHNFLFNLFRAEEPVKPTHKNSINQRDYVASAVS